MSLIKEETPSQNVEDILEDLSYSMASPEAEYFHRLMADNKYTEAQSLLNEHISEEESSIVINYFKSKNNQTIELKEISLSENFKAEPEQMYLFKLGAGLYQSSIEEWHGTLAFFAQNTFQPLEKAQQIWKILNI
jgi:hypothetical protein